jgi:branched-chain amino acid transport system ATP-binding protein
VLKLQNISKSFGGIVAVDDASFEVEEGRIEALIGPNGAGKTTIFNLISGLEVPTTGNIEFLGRDITRMPPHKIAAMGMARTFQSLQLFGKMSVLENVLMGLHLKYRCGFIRSGLWLRAVDAEENAMRNKAFEILEFMDLVDRKDAVASTLPYGDQRLVEIARALAVEPLLLLLDEPAAGLNHREMRVLGKKIKAMNALGMTVLVVEHNMGLVMRVCHEIVVVNHGRKIAQGPPERIRTDPQVITAYLGVGKEGS